MIMDDHDAKFKKLWNFRGEEDLAFAEWLKKKKTIKPTLPLKFKMKF